MLHRDVIDLISCTYSVNDIGDSVAQETKRTVFVDVISFTGKRKTEVQTSGNKAEIIFRLSDMAEYQNEQLIEYKGERYNITQVSIKDDHCVDITVRHF